MLWTIFITPLLPVGDAPLGVTYGITIAAIILTAVLGVGWEYLYHFLQQYRWEKDWPILYGLVLGIPEGFVIWISVSILFINSPPPFFAFWFHFLTTWTLLWLVAIGPLKVFFPRWRYIGGRIIEP